jgi:hypothetical protein
MQLEKTLFAKLALHNVEHVHRKVKHKLNV